MWKVGFPENAEKSGVLPLYCRLCCWVSFSCKIHNILAKTFYLTF